MTRILFALAATAALVPAAMAQGYPGPRGVYVARQGVSPDEIRDYERDQLDRRQEMERKALRMHQKAERRAFGMDDD